MVFAVDAKAMMLQAAPKIYVPLPAPVGTKDAAVGAAPKNWTDVRKINVHSPTPTGSMVNAASALLLVLWPATLTNAHLLLPRVLQ
jgi:hypothetical protein